MSMDIRALAYLVAETTDVAAWKTYAEQVVGAMTEPTAEGGLPGQKSTERQQRTVIRPGSAGSPAGVGLGNCKAEFEAAKAVLQKHGVAFSEGGKDDRKQVLFIPETHQP